MPDVLTRRGKGIKNGAHRVKATRAHRGKATKANQGKGPWSKPNMSTS